MSNHIPLDAKVPEMACPKCEKKMQSGYVAGHQLKLRWVDRPNTKTVFAGEKLKVPFLFFSAPS